MKILVLSDSHSKVVTMDTTEYDYIIHCGDYGCSKLKKEVLYVRGNCDLDGPKEICTEIENRKVYITHGDLYRVKFGYDRLRYRALELKANLCFFGHTHRADMFIMDDIIFINPGAYQNGYYVIIDEESIGFYLDKKCYKKFEFKW